MPPRRPGRVENGALETRHLLSQWRALTCRALLAASEGRFADAERLSAEALAVAQPDASRAFESLIAHRTLQNIVASRRGEIEPLADGLRMLVQRAPGVPIAELGLASFHVKLGDLDAARECVGRCLREALLQKCNDLEIVHMLAYVGSELKDETSSARRCFPFCGGTAG